MLGLVCSVLYALAISIPICVGLGFVYYWVCVGLMTLLRGVLGEEHRGYYLLNIAVLALFLTFFVVFSFFVRRF